ncbi:hypothetical protein D3C72_2425610 [compost metagenome]
MIASWIMSRMRRAWMKFSTWAEVGKAAERLPKARKPVAKLRMQVTMPASLRKLVSF